MFNKLLFSNPLMVAKNKRFRVIDKFHHLQKKEINVLSYSYLKNVSVPLKTVFTTLKTYTSLLHTLSTGKIIVILTRD